MAKIVHAGLLDEMEIHIVPVLLGGGRRLSDHLDVKSVELRLTRVVDAPAVTHLQYRVNSRD